MTHGTVTCQQRLLGAISRRYLSDEQIFLYFLDLWLLFGQRLYEGKLKDEPIQFVQSVCQGAIHQRQFLCFAHGQLNPVQGRLGEELVGRGAYSRLSLCVAPVGWPLCHSFGKLYRRLRKETQAWQQLAVWRFFQIKRVVT